MPIDRADILRQAEKLLRQGKLERAIAEYLRVVEDQPRDWNTANMLGDLYARAGQIDKALEQFSRIADSLSDEGFLPKASALYKKVLKIRPDDEHALAQAAHIAWRQGLLVEARGFLNAVCEQQRRRGDIRGLAASMIRMAELDPNDHQARLAAARARVTLGDVAEAVRDLQNFAEELAEANRLDTALVALREAAQLAPEDPDVHRALARLLHESGDPSSDDAAHRAALMEVDEAVARSNWVEAVAVLEGILRRTPTDVPVLQRLVEVCADGGLDDIIEGAQARLADAHLAAGSAAEARFIAEDLLARRPREAAHLERLRGALTLLGEPDPDAVIAQRLAGIEDIAIHVPPEPRAAVIVDPQEALEEVQAIEIVDSGEVVDEEASRPRQRTEEREEDLTVVLDDIGPSPSASPYAPTDLETVFAQFREEATRRVELDGVEQALQHALSLYRAGQVDAAVVTLERVSRVPALRFDAASALATICRERGHLLQAIEWWERALEAPATSPEASHRVFYQLADALESVGEVGRALAICLELRAEAGDYRDVAQRVDRLARLQAQE